MIRKHMLFYGILILGIPFSLFPQPTQAQREYLNARNRNQQLMWGQYFLERAMDEANRIYYRLANSTGNDIQEIYISYSSDDTWGRNLWQREDLLPSGYNVEMYSYDVGPYDILVIDTNGTAYLKNRIRITKDMMIYITDDDKYEARSSLF